MKEVKSVNIFKMINAVIKSGKTGTPEEFAKKLDMSLSNFKRYIYTMRKTGTPLFYSRKLKTYYYSEKGNFTFGFVKE
jgi:hypothetical protein